jgi:hypothetical protein
LQLTAKDNRRPDEHPLVVVNVIDRHMGSYTAIAKVWYGIKSNVGVQGYAMLADYREGWHKVTMTLGDGWAVSWKATGQKADDGTLTVTVD